MPHGHHCGLRTADVAALAFGAQPLKVDLDDTPIVLPQRLAVRPNLGDRPKDAVEEAHVVLRLERRYVHVCQLEPRPVEALAVEAGLTIGVALPVYLGLLLRLLRRRVRVERQHDLSMHHLVLLVVDDGVGRVCVGGNP